MMTHEWTKLNPEDVTTERADPAVGLFCSPSPYNLPIAFRVSKLPNTDKRMIEFQYLDGNEPAIFGPEVDANIRFALGKKSERVFRVVVDGAVFQSNPREVLTSIYNAMMNLRANHPRAHDNFEATSHAFTRIGERLLQS